MPIPVIIGLLVAAIGSLATISLAVRSREKGSSQKSRKNKDRESRIKDANRKLAQNPKDPEALRVLGDAYFEDQQWDKAMKTFGALINLGSSNPDVDEYHANLRYGLAAVRAGNLDEAYKGLIIARTMNKDSFEINYNLGYLEYKRKNYEKALGMLRVALEKQPEHFESQRFLGLTQYRLKHYKEAIPNLRRVVEARPDDKEAMFFMGQAHYELGQTDNALKIFSHLRADPQLGPHASLLAGSLNMKIRRYDQAQMDFELGLRHENIRGDIALELKYRLASAHAKKQEVDQALPLLMEVYQSNPDYKDVASQLERMRELNSNKNLQTFLIAPASDFVTLCRKVVNGYFANSATKITDISVRKGELVDVLAEVNTTKWEDVILFRFIRTTGQTGELMLRDFHSRIKDVKAGRGFCLTAGAFTDSAKKFVEARLIDLVGKDELVKVLNKVG